MKIRNKKGVEFEISAQDYQNQIVSQGNGHKYCVVEDDAPVEVKQLRIKKAQHGKEEKEKKV